MSCARAHVNQGVAITTQGVKLALTVQLARRRGRMSQRRRGARKGSVHWGVTTQQPSINMVTQTKSAFDFFHMTFLTFNIEVDPKAAALDAASPTLLFRLW